jgi:CHRD domain-containing protein
MFNRRLLIRTIGVAAGLLVIAAAGPASAHDGHGAPAVPLDPAAPATAPLQGMPTAGVMPGMPEMPGIPEMPGMPAAAPAPVSAPGAGAPAAGGQSYFAADLNGANETPVKGGPAVGDKDGRGHAIVRISGNQICFTLDWSRIGAPTLGHIHSGAARVNGPVQVGFFGSALPEPIDTATGCVAADAATVADITAHPDKHYVNLHTAAFPGGAIRGQLKKSRPVDLLRALRGPLATLLDGGQEVPAAGDPDGHGTGFVRTHGGQISFAATWSGIATPTLGHIHAGPIGTAGAVAVPLFAAPGGLPASVSGVAGVVTADRALVHRINENPSEYYMNLHNTEFAAGAMRGQLFRAGGDR